MFTMPTRGMNRSPAPPVRTSTMAEPCPQVETRRTASWWWSLVAVLAAVGLAAVSARHLLGASTAWLTPFDVVVSLALVALCVVSVVAALSHRVGLRIAVPALLLGANVGFIIAHLTGHEVVRFAAYPSARFSITLAVAIAVGAVGLVRRRMWARWLYLALGAAAIGSGGLNAINFWSVSGHFDAHNAAWSTLMLEQTWGYLISVVAGLLIVGNLAPIGDRFVAGPSHATWTSDLALMRTLRWLTVACLMAVPMLLVYAWVQPLVPATTTSALALAATLTLGVATAVRGRVIGTLILCAGGLGLAAQTVATYALATPQVQPITRYYAAFWLPAAALALVAAAQLAAPVARLLRR